MWIGGKNRVAKCCGNTRKDWARNKFTHEIFRWFKARLATTTAGAKKKINNITKYICTKLNQKWMKIDLSVVHFKLEGNIVGRKVCLRTDLSPPPVTFEPTLSLSWYAGGCGPQSCALSWTGQTLPARRGVGLTEGLQRASFPLGWCRVVSMQLWLWWAVGPKNAASLRVWAQVPHIV